VGAASVETLKTTRQYFDAGRLDAADALLREYFALGFESLDAHVLAGIIAAKQNRFDVAAGHLERAVALDADSLDGLAWLATVRNSQGDAVSAITLLERALALKRDDPAMLSLLGICYLSLGQAKRAASCFLKVVKIEPRAGQAYFNLGMALRLQNHAHESADAFLQAVAYAPERAENYLQAFKQLQQVGRWEEALQYLENGRKRHPNSAALTEALGVAYGRLNLPEKAEATFLSAFATDSNVAVAYATWLQEQGRFQESGRVLQQALATNPRSGPAFRALAEARVFELDGERVLDKMLPLYSDPSLDERSKMHLAYGIAKAYDSEGHYQEAMRFFDIANAAAFRIYPAGKSFNLAETESDSAIMAGIYTRELIQKMRPFGSVSRKPIFIVGMIRSGTTLLDQIVASHRDVGAAGELPFWTVEADKIHRAWRKEPNADDLAPLAAHYLATLGAASPGTPRVSDKSPLNFRHLGLISVALPKSKIIHIRRNPLDTCVSIYTTFFAGGPNFTYNQANTVAYYRAYLDLMDYWCKVLPKEQFYELDYEELVANPETTIRGVIHFCDLEWDDACLAPHLSERAIATPSRWQARQPIYASSVERWRRYAPWLGALLNLSDVK
jgi:tetratricopeptide (TPR) repeat protein